MGSGNKDKRRRQRAEGGAKFGAGPGTIGKSGAWLKNQDSGVNFEIEPDADQIFLDSMGAIDEKLVRRKSAADEWEPNGERGARRSDGPITTVIDLHRLRLDEATMMVEQAIGEILGRLKNASGATQLTLKIITGKGLHSGAGGSVLAREIHRHVRQRYGISIVSLEESPAEVTLGGVPIRGHFHVTFGRK